MISLLQIATLMVGCAQPVVWTQASVDAEGGAREPVDPSEASSEPQAAGPVITSPDEGVLTERTVLVEGTCTDTAGPVSVQATGSGAPEVSVACVDGHFEALLELYRDAGAEEVDLVAIQDGKTDEQTVVVGICPRGLAGQGGPIDDGLQADTQGRWCLVSNQVDGQPNFSVDGTRIGMADPTALSIGGRFYVTGTSDDARTSNFPIYVSDDLVTWRLHGWAFEDRDGDATNTTVTLDNGRTFCSLWDPELDVRDQTVWLTFTGVEDLGLGSCDQVEPWRVSTLQTAEVALADFVAGEPFSSNPKWFGYRIDNAGDLYYDGGYHQHLVDGRSRTIPTTGRPDDVGTQPWQTLWWGDEWASSPCFVWGGCNTWMRLAGFVHTEPDGQRWLLYNWVVDSTDSAAASWRGNHIAAYPLSGDYLLDAEAPEGSHIPLAFARNTTNPVGGTENGCQGATEASSYCVAEGPAVFEWQGNTYVLFSRNHWDSAAYGTFYRYTAGGIADLALPAWDAADVSEHALITSADRTKPYGVSYGHASVFTGPTETPWVVFHAKQDPSKGDGLPHRTVYFKQLRFEGDGTLLPLQNEAADPRADIAAYAVPRPMP